MRKLMLTRVIVDVAYEGSELVNERYWEHFSVALDKRMLLNRPMEFGEIVDIGTREPNLLQVYSPDRTTDEDGLARFVIVHHVFAEYLAECSRLVADGFFPYDSYEDEWFWDWPEEEHEAH